ncbi:class I SAM-dependent methyltransferase [Actinomadura barringtoniae]|uniref:Class I SAM-dependent methyltransferase n=1 Tax=Actinomadura barringtoniae TaxID=1427535 RepID=A0A939PBA2_9ACTN|nr:class I SAM-dependent methyltransferase [Actinomadura barringtoniae]MBO2449456.1 class I SAM-dependent methyltransferase [Actinomadura barringtoniae]
MLPSPPAKPVPPSDTTAILRTFARDLAAGHPWTPEAAKFFTDVFDELAATWDTGQATGRDEPLRDALTRGGPLPTGPCLEIGSGTGAHTRLLTTAFPAVISLDLSEQMLRQATGRSPARIRADAAALPIADASITAVVAVDMLLFPSEIARVLAPDGVLLWINQLGPDGPLYLPATTVAAALPGHWQATESEAGWGTWAALRAPG